MKQMPTAPSSFTPDPRSMSSDITGKIFQMMKHRQACDMEDLLEACSSYTWNQVFLEVDRRLYQFTAIDDCTRIRC